VRLLGVTSTQAVLEYTAPENTPCRIELSESPAYSPPVPDVDPSLFPGADRDNRPGSLSAGAERVVVIGRHGMSYSGSANPFLGADGNRHSRALQANTTHYYRITCGAAVSTGTLQTGNIALGNTYGEPLPPDPLRPGHYNWPDIDPASRRETIVDPVTGALIRKLTVSADSNPDSPNSWPVGGMFSLCSHVPLVKDGHTFYLCAIPSSGDATLLSIDTTTGDAYPLSRLVVPYMRFGNGAAIPCPYAWFDGADPDRFYFVGSINGSASVIMGEWRGKPDMDYPVNASENASSPPLKWTNLTPGEGGLDGLLAQFDSRFDSRQRGAMYVDATGVEDGKLLVRLWANQDAGGWVVVFDPGSNRHAAGGRGEIVAAVPVWQAPAARWCGLHAAYSSGDHSTWVSIVDNFISGGTALLAGPYRVKVAGADGADIGQNDTVLAIEPQNGLYEPLDPTPGPAEGNGYLMDAQPGDLFFLDRNGDGAYTPGVDEYVELVSKDPARHTWTVLRGSQMQQSPFYAHSGLSPKLESFPAPAGTYLYAACRTQSLVTPASATLWWNFAGDPHGENLVPPGVSGLKSAEVIEHVYTGAHTVTRDQTSVMASNGPATMPVSWTEWTLASGVPGLDTENGAVLLNARPSFEGAAPPGLGNTYQQHPSYEQMNAPQQEKQWFLDVLPLVDGTESYGKADLVSGTSGVYRVTGSTLTRDRLPTLATCGTSALQDISSAAKGDTIGDATPFTYCVARNAGECRAGSSAGDAYVSCPRANYRLPGDPATTVRCYGSEVPANVVDICLGDLWPYGQSMVQTGFSGTSPNGEYSRVITQDFDAWHTGIFDNARATPDGRWAMFKSAVTGSVEAYMAKLPPFPAPDGIRRDGYIPVKLSLAPPDSAAGIDNAVVRFGYSGNGAPGDFYCTTRREACVKGGQPQWQYGFVSDSVKGVPCASGCAVTLPLIPQRIAYYRVEYRNASNRVVATEDGVAGETWSYSLQARQGRAPGVKGGQ
jgi:hypothetical protein